MSLTEDTYTELRNLFNSLKKASQSDKGDDKIQECGDNLASSNDPVQIHFDALHKRIDEIMSSMSAFDDGYYKILAMKASLVYEQAKIQLTTEDNPVSQELLEKALGIIVDAKNNPQVSFLYFRIVNHLAYLLSKKGNLTKSKELLEKVTADEFGSNILVYSTEELFLNTIIDQSQASSKLNKLLVNNLQMLGWVYGKLGYVDLHALKQHEALEHQLNVNDGDPVLWASRCTRVSTLFLSLNQWVNARYHLSASGTALDTLEGSVTPHPELGKAQADLARGWIHYGLQLFSYSKKAILDQMYSAEEPLNVSDELKSDDEELLEEKFQFTNLEVVAAAVPGKSVKNTEQARALFLHTHMWLKRARVYYTLRDYPLQYVNAVLDLSELYRFLAFFEPDLDSQYNVQKRRADALETLSTVLKEVRPQCYVAVSVELLRELAEVQIELMGINLRRLYIAEGSAACEDSIRRRMQAVSDIHAKLETVGDMLGHSTLDEQELTESEPSPSHDCDPNDSDERATIEG